MRRTVGWIGAFVVATLVGGGAVVAANATVLGPGDFVRIYLDALARGDSAGALALPGVDAGSAADTLLHDDALTGLSDIRQVRDEPLGDDRHRITMSWSTPAGDGETPFVVERIGTRFGVFPEWGFVESPIAVLELDVSNDARFEANGMPATTGRTSAGAAELAVFVPGEYVLTHDTDFLMAEPVMVLADEVGATIDATVEIEPGPAFLPALADEVALQLAACTEQRILFPTDCPFGRSIDDRLASDPAWSIVHLPELEVEPGGFGTWIAGPAPGTAHLTVEVQSLFDGSIETFDEDVPFQARYVVVISGTTLQVTNAPAE